VRVLLDESLPRDLRDAIVGHDVDSVHGRRWTGLSNGALLHAAREAGVEVLVTVDRNMEHQQNIQGAGLALIVLRAHSNRLPDLLPLVPRLLEVLPTVRPEEITHVAG
jgi:predicted nuclease of predicted toxin-antitoxin system